MKTTPAQKNLRIEYNNAHFKNITTFLANRHYSPVALPLKDNMPITEFSTTLVAQHGRYSSVYCHALIQYYLLLILCYPIAYLFNCSFILHHPDRPLPIPVSPSWNRTIHSFYLNIDMYHYLMQHFPHTPVVRRWMNRFQLERRVLPESASVPPIELNGELHGPRLRQGMLAYQGGRALFIREEFGRLPTQAEYITAASFVIHSQTAISLHIPIRHIDIQGLQDEEFQSPFHEAECFEENMTVYYQTLWASTGDNTV